MTIAYRTAAAERTRRIWLDEASGIAALLAGALLVIAVIDLIITGPATDTAKGWLTPFQDNWLMVIFKVYAATAGYQIDRLQAFNFLDLAILVLVALLYVGLYRAARKGNTFWPVVALLQPFLGIGLFIVTRSAGRSSVMGAGIVISAVMLRNATFSKPIAWMGLLASMLLLAGDLGAGEIPSSNLIASVFGVGYLLLIVWLFLVGRKLHQIGSAGRGSPGHA